MKNLIVISLLCSTCFGVSPSLQSYNTGQVTPFLEGRTDFQKYRSGTRILENMFVFPQGPAIRRPGTRYIQQYDGSYSGDASEGVPLIVPLAATQGKSYKIDMDGELDTSWATNGIYDDLCTDQAAIREFSNGELLLYCFCSSATCDDPGDAWSNDDWLHRIDANGSLVTSWATSGKLDLTVLLGNAYMKVDDLIVDSNDDIYVCSDVAEDYNQLAKLNADGTEAWAAGRQPGGGYPRLNKNLCMALNTDETRLLVGSQPRLKAGGVYVNIYALDTSDGSLDTNWATDGYFNIVGSGSGKYVYGIHLDSDDGIYVSHENWDVGGAGTDYCLSKILPDGSAYDTSWGTSGHTCSGANLKNAANEGNRSFCINSDGTIGWVGSDSSKSYVKHFDATGTEIWDVNDTGTDMFRTIHPVGNYYYVTRGAGAYDSHTLYRFEIADGTYDSTFDANVIPLGAVQNALWVDTDSIAVSITANSVRRLIPFEYSTDDSYVLALGDNFMGFFRTVE